MWSRTPSRLWNPFPLFALLALTLFACRPETSPKAPEDGSAAPAVTAWANRGTTTPLLPLLGAAEEAGWRLDLRPWNTTMAFQSLLLAGEGEFWVGHLEGFARAARRGAPLRILAVTGWRKWQLLSRREGVGGFPEDFLGREVSIAPADGAGRFLLEKLLREEGVAGVKVVPVDVRPLLLKAMEGKAEDLFLPEPFATVLLEKGLGFQRVDSLEAYYGRVRGGAPEVPWAGVAVNAHWAEAHPRETEELLEGMMAWNSRGGAREGEGEGVSRLWTAGREEASGISREALAESLLRDPVKVVPAWRMEGEVREFLKVVAPELAFRPEWLWRPPAGKEGDSRQ